jgi:hypothetical protein
MALSRALTVLATTTPPAAWSRLADSRAITSWAQL